MKRRSFIKLMTASSAAIAFPSIVRAQTLGLGGGTAPSNRITFGCIGLGGQGMGDMHNILGNPLTQIIAVCDVDQEHRQAAQKRVTEKYTKDTASGTYTLKGSFTLLKPSGHANYYGLVFGGSGLEGADQTYLYFEVAQNGTWLVKKRDGNATSNVVGRTPSDAVKKPDDSGKSVNDLEVRVGADKIDFVVNGTVVHSEPKTGAVAKTDGIYGIRVNHLLDVQVDGFVLSK